MLIRRTPKIHASEVTDERTYLDRREFMAASGLIAGTALGGARDGGGLLGSIGRLLGNEDDELTPYEDVTTYNNFYEFGTCHRRGRGEPAR